MTRRRWGTRYISAACLLFLGGAGCETTPDTAERSALSQNGPADISFEMWEPIAVKKGDNSLFRIERIPIPGGYLYRVERGYLGDDQRWVGTDTHYTVQVVVNWALRQ